MRKNSEGKFSAPSTSLNNCAAFSAARACFSAGVSGVQDHKKIEQSRSKGTFFMIGVLDYSDHTILSVSLLE